MMAVSTQEELKRITKLEAETAKLRAANAKVTAAIREVQGRCGKTTIRGKTASCVITDEVAINVIFDGPPSHVSGRFVEVEDDDGHSINAGEWIERGDGCWALRITNLPADSVVVPVEPTEEMGLAGNVNKMTPLNLDRIEELLALRDKALQLTLQPMVGSSDAVYYAYADADEAYRQSIGEAFDQLSAARDEIVRLLRLPEVEQENIDRQVVPISWCSVAGLSDALDQTHRIGFGKLANVSLHKKNSTGELVCLWISKSNFKLIRKECEAMGLRPPETVPDH